MRVITARNVQSALHFGLELFRRVGVNAESRNGPVIFVPGPVTTHYTRPLERVLFWPQRDANPFFHFFESLWMLAGRKDAAFVGQFAKQMLAYVDNDAAPLVLQELHGAYGYRWRWHFTWEGNEGPLPDQLPIIAARLKKDPNDRRCVLTMWDPEIDLDATSKDIPCNTHVYFSRSINSDLDMTVCCRSNDMIWGGYGANAVHFSVLQEWMAHAIGCDVGNYWHISNNYHAYRNIYDPLVQKFARVRYINDPYMSSVKPYPLLADMTKAEQWLEDCEKFCEDPDASPKQYRDPFFKQMAHPLWLAHKAYKAKEYQEAIKLASGAFDWNVACKEWIERREAAHERAKDDGPNHEAK